MKNYVLLAVLISLLSVSCAPKVVATTATDKVVVVQTPPSNHRVIIVKGKRYYKWNGKHYRKTNRGYVRVKIRTI